MRVEQAAAEAQRSTETEIPSSTEAFFRDCLHLDKPDPDGGDRPVLFPAQWVLVKVAFDHVDPIDLETEEERDIARQMFGPVERISESARHTVAMLKGARVGGTWLWSLYLLHRALTADLSRLGPGEIGFGGIIAERKELGYQSLNYISGALSFAGLDHLRTNQAKESIDILRGDGHKVTIQVFAAAGGGAATRGRTYFAVLLDEACFFKSADGSKVNDVEIYRSVAPRVIAGGMVGIVSTAWAEAGLLWDLVQRNLGSPGGKLHGKQETALALITPTELLRQDDKIRADIRIARDTDPDNAAREFDCIPLTGEVGCFFDGVAITQAIALGEASDTELGALPGRDTIVGVGIDTGLVSDSSAEVIVHRDDVRTADGVDSVYRVAAFVEMKPTHTKPLKLSEVCSTYAKLMIEHGKRVGVSDQHEIEPSREHLEKHRCSLDPIPGGNQGKLDTYTVVKDLLDSGKLLIDPTLVKLIRQVREVMSKPVPGGGVKIWSPRSKSGHGDIISALVAAIYDAKRAETAAMVPKHSPKPASRWGRGAQQRGF